MASSDLNIGPTGPAASIPTSRALTRVTPVLPRPAASPDGPPLDRSGLNVRDLLNTADHVVTRSRTPAIALDMGLEHARGSMVRNHPADALAMLDEVWSGARHTETGWYLRASSLALLGLPGEAARVAADAVTRNPQSSANHFLLSLAKLSLGELQAARASVAEAVRHRDPDALLLVQSALLEAQSGNVHDAEALLRRAAVQWPEHQAIAYGRRMIRQVMQHATHDQQSASNLRDLTARGQTPLSSRTPVSLQAVAEDGPVTNFSEVPAETFADLVSDALQHLGAKLRTGSTQDIAVAARSVLTSLSTGGALANATSPARAHV
ncbi:MAG: hypothetical protein H7Z40_18705, partial [Phycisphaerae bacterium]|nr:hypothetical protein [Gemmatimonadaceae bacterium]